MANDRPFFFVSTHSRLKAAGWMFIMTSHRRRRFQHTAALRRLAGCQVMQELEELPGFNTQPPEGGWNKCELLAYRITRFNTQPPEGGWILVIQLSTTHHGFNTQPPEGGWLPSVCSSSLFSCCFNTPPPEGGWVKCGEVLRPRLSFNTQPPEGGWPFVNKVTDRRSRFQHTAA